MKKLFILAAAALLTLGIVSCERDTDPNPTSGQWVDLGLPSGLLWYSVNLGATAPEQYGDYYAWGETRPKETYNWSTYSYATADADGSLQTLIKYNTSSTYGTVDNLTTLQPSDDAATQVLGGGARIPTQAEWQELLDNTTAEWTTLNNVNGRKFTGPNGNSLFLPAAGGRYGSELGYAGSYGDYWSASLDESDPYNAWDVRSDPDYAWTVHFDSGNRNVRYGNNRYYGQSVRAVCSRSQN